MWAMGRYVGQILGVEKIGPMQWAGDAPVDNVRDVYRRWQAERENIILHSTLTKNNFLEHILSHFWDFIV